MGALDDSINAQRDAEAQRRLRNSGPTPMVREFIELMGANDVRPLPCYTETRGIRLNPQTRRQDFYYTYGHRAMGWPIECRGGAYDLVTTNGEFLHCMTKVVDRENRTVLIYFCDAASLGPEWMAEKLGYAARVHLGEVQDHDLTRLY